MDITDHYKNIPAFIWHLNDTIFLLEMHSCFATFSWMHDVVKDYYAPIHLAMSSVGKYLEVENVVRDEASLYSKGFSGVHVGLFKDIIYIPLLDLYNYGIFFFFSSDLHRKFQWHSWECRGGSIQLFMYLPKKILWCSASFSSLSWNASLTVVLTVHSMVTRLAGCLAEVQNLLSLDHIIPF